MAKDKLPLLTVVGDKIALGPASMDLAPLFAAWRNDMFIQRTQGFIPGPVTVESMEKSIEDEGSRDDGYGFVIYERSSMKAIGRCGLFELDWRHRTAEFGMLIGEAGSRGKGYASEVALLVLDYAFTALGMHTVYLRVDEFNTAGRKAYAKAGFKPAGVLREATWLNGKRYDLLMMDCVASEFESPVLGKIFQPEVER